MRPRSKKREKLDREVSGPLKARLLLERPICERCQREPSVDPHHKLRQSTGREQTNEDNILMLCRADHEWVHDHPAQAREEGLLRRRFDGASSRND